MTGSRAVQPVQQRRRLGGALLRPQGRQPGFEHGHPRQVVGCQLLLLVQAVGGARRGFGVGKALARHLQRGLRGLGLGQHRGAEPGALGQVAPALDGLLGGIRALGLDVHVDLAPDGVGPVGRHQRPFIGAGAERHLVDRRGSRLLRSGGQCQRAVQLPAPLGDARALQQRHRLGPRQVAPAPAVERAVVGVDLLQGLFQQGLGLRVQELAAQVQGQVGLVQAALIKRRGGHGLGQQGLGAGKVTLVADEQAQVVQRPGRTVDLGQAGQGLALRLGGAGPGVRRDLLAQGRGLRQGGLAPGLRGPTGRQQCHQRQQHRCAGTTPPAAGAGSARPLRGVRRDRERRHRWAGPPSGSPLR